MTLRLARSREARARLALRAAQTCYSSTVGTRRSGISNGARVLSDADLDAAIAAIQEAHAVLRLAYRDVEKARKDRP